MGSKAVGVAVKSVPAGRSTVVAGWAVCTVVTLTVVDREIA
jgi:hypothetical protein